MTELGETIATTIDDLERTKRGIDTGSIYRFSMFKDEFTTDDTYLLVRKRGTGSSFIWGHRVWGMLGSQSTQPYLGDSRAGTWTQIAVYSGATAP